MKRLFLLLLIPLAQTLTVKAAVHQPADTALNQQAPDFRLKDIHGKTVSHY